MEMCPDMIFTHNRGGTFIFVSSASIPLLGHAPHEMIGHSMFDFLSPHDVRDVRAGVSRMLQKPKVYTMIYRVRKKDGTFVWFETVSTPIKNDNGHVEEIVCVSRDITDRKRTEDVLRAREKQFERLANAAPVLMWLSDHYGKYVFFNESWLKFTGRRLQDMYEGGWTKSVYEADLLRIRKNYRRSAHSLQPFSHEYRLLDAKGEYHWVLERAVPRFSEKSIFEGYVGTCIDVSELKSVQRELRANNRSLQQFKFAFDSMPDHMVISDRDGTILYANAAAERITGYSKEEMIGKKHGSRELWGGYMTHEYYQKMWNTIKKDKDSFVGKIYNRRKSGEWYWSEMHIHPLLGPNRGVRFYIATERVIPESEGELQNVSREPREKCGKDTYTENLFGDA